MMQENVVPAAANDMESVNTLLEACGLPTEGIEADNVAVFVVRGADGVVACGALEMYGANVLLRSVAVAASARGRGLGGRITEHALVHARRHGATSVFLLTETAEGFFPRFGFTVTERAEVPEDIAATAEFSRLCPDSAVAMQLKLAP